MQELRKKAKAIQFLTLFLMRKVDSFMLGSKLASTSTPTMLSLLSLAILNVIITVKQATVNI